MSAVIDTSKLDSLENDRVLLVNQLEAKGVEADTSETMTALVGKVDTIVTGELSPDPYSTGMTTFNMYYDDSSRRNTALSIFDGVYEPFIAWLLDSNSSTYRVSDCCPGIVSLHLKSNYRIGTNRTTLYMICSYLTYLETVTVDNGFGSNSITSIEGMFSACEKLKSVNLCGMNITNVTNVRNLFSSCVSLTDIDLHTWDTSKIVNFDGMFGNCTSLKHLDISNFTFGENLSIRLYGMFNNYIEYLDISGLDFVNTPGSTFSGQGDTFAGMNKNCFIYVKDQANLDFIQESRRAYGLFTNIHVKEV